MIYYTTQKDKLKYLRAVCRKNGLIFKKQNAYINGEQAYLIEHKKTGCILSQNHTIKSAYDNQTSCFFIDSLNC